MRLVILQSASLLTFEGIAETVIRDLLLFGYKAWTVGRSSYTGAKVSSTSIISAMRENG
jgi:hypothetical protein